MDASSRIAAGDLRRHHLGLVLGEVVHGSAISRAGIAAATGLTRSTVSGLTAELLAGGLVRDIGAGPGATSGRPGRRLVPDPAGPVGIALQVEQDGVGGCLVDLAGRAGARRWHRTGIAGSPPQRAARALAPVLRELLLAAAGGDRPAAGIVLAVPGVVAGPWPAATAAVSSPALGWDAVAIGAPVAAEAERLGAGGIALEVRCAAALAAEAEPDAGPAGGTTVHVGGYSEIGVALVRDGRAGGRAATRFGHLTARPGGAACPCGRRGCLVVETRPDVQPDPGRSGRLLGRALAGFAAPIDPDRVVLGGRFAAAGPAFAAAVTAELHRHGIPADRVAPATLGADAALRGAGRAALAPVIADPWAWITGETTP
ncbi:ROK family transcriptional regulator [Pseudonocardia sp. ICBG1293]|uniref:ROK family transcriptional regulator n=1 Tax=Pseudonocardia sp. ICBG1293 TaxID=2844382 RepID=UPI001CCE1246|nr:ROK family transcriptional regulator [Pseudonocardia sp. ICBG1293]